MMWGLGGAATSRRRAVPDAAQQQVHRLFEFLALPHEAYDKLFERAQTLPDGRSATRSTGMLSDHYVNYAPVLFTLTDLERLVYPWVRAGRCTRFNQYPFQYLDIDCAKQKARMQMRAERHDALCRRSGARARCASCVAGARCDAGRHEQDAARRRSSSTSPAFDPQAMSDAYSGYGDTRRFSIRRTAYDYLARPYKLSSQTRDALPDRSPTAARRSRSR
jgi:hypothetical protein